MSRTQGRFSADLGHPDGQFFIPATALTATSGTVTATRNGSGDFSVNIGNSQTCVFWGNLEELIFRYGEQDYLAEQFGSNLGATLIGSQGLVVSGYTTVVTTQASAGTNVNVAVGSSANFTVGRAVQPGALTATYITALPDATHITLASLSGTLAVGKFISENLFTTPAGVTGPPPFTGTTQLTPVTTPRSKGIRVRQIYPWYLISGLALSTNTIALTQNTAANITANTVANIIASGANGLATATNANPYLTPIMLATPAYLTTKFTSYNLEWDVTTGASGTARIYGIFVDLEFNYD